ncbi:MAG TPA: tripartite tricarboxylate transporter substrate binding protein [Beijerinckiaceae bacterium]
MRAFRRLSRLLALAALSLTAPLSATAQEPAWPARTVTIVVPYPAGGNTDMMARLAGEFLAKRFGQGFVVENRPAGNGAVAAAQIAQAPADGHTLFFAAAVQMIILPMMRQVNYDPQADFTPVSIFGAGPFALGVHKSVPAETLDEFLAFAKASGRKIDVASAGSGGIAHLAAALLAKKAGFEPVFVPYRGGGPAANALAAGDVHAYFGNASEMITLAEGGGVKVIAVSSAQPIPQLPRAVTVASRFPGFDLTSWNGFLVAKNTPKPIVDKLQEGVAAAARDPVIAQRLTSLGVQPMGSTAEEFARVLETERPLFAAAVEAAGLEPAK